MTAIVPNQTDASPKNRIFPEPVNRIGDYALYPLSCPGSFDRVELKI